MFRVTHIVSGDVWGGAEAQALLLLLSLKRLGSQVSILLFNRGELYERIQESGIEHRLLDESARFGFFKSAQNALQALKPDIVVTHGYKECFVGNKYSRTFSVPQIDIHHGASENRSGLKKLKADLYRFIRKCITRSHAAKVVAVSHQLAEDLQIDTWSNLEIIYNAVAETNTSPKEEEFLLQRPAILVVGRLSKVKRVDLAINAFHSLIQDTNLNESPTLYIVGEGPERFSLERKCREMELAHRVSFLGFRTDAPSLINKADILLISSDSEGLPTVMLEAMQSTVPIVSTAVGGIPEVLDKFPDYPARLLSAGDCHGIAQALSEILSEEKREIPVEFHQTFTALFSPDAVAAKHLALYKTVLEKT